MEAITTIKDVPRNPDGTEAIEVRIAWTFSSLEEGGELLVCVVYLQDGTKIAEDGYAWLSVRCSAFRLIMLEDEAFQLACERDAEARRV